MAGVEPLAHSALYYRGEREYVVGTVSFVRTGLAAGEPVAVAVPRERLGVVRAALGDDAARVRTIDMSVAGRNPGRIIPAVIRAFADAHPPGQRARFVGEPVWAGRSAREYPACVQYEALINLAFAGRPLSVLCPYDAGALAPDTLADAQVTHPTVITGGTATASTSYDPAWVTGSFAAPLPQPAGEVVTIEFDADGLPRVRDLAEQAAIGHGLGPGRAWDVKIIAGELAANSLRHGGGSGRLRLWDDEGHLVCEISDSGRLTDPLAGRRPPRADHLGGHGLLLVNHLADLVRLRTAAEGTTVQAYFARDSAR